MFYYVDLLMGSIVRDVKCKKNESKMFLKMSNYVFRYFIKTIKKRASIPESDAVN